MTVDNDVPKHVYPTRHQLTGVTMYLMAVQPGVRVCVLMNRRLCKVQRQVSYRIELSYIFSDVNCLSS